MNLLKQEKDYWDKIRIKKEDEKKRRYLKTQIQQTKIDPFVKIVLYNEQPKTVTTIIQTNEQPKTVTTIIQTTKKESYTSFWRNRSHFLDFR